MDASMIRLITESTEPLYQEVCADQLTGLNPELGADLQLQPGGKMLTA